MNGSEKIDIFTRIREHAFREISPQKLSTTNLSLDTRVRKTGEQIGPAFQKIVAEQDTLVVFVDDMPGANFGHPCRYFLYSANTGAPYNEVDASFPPIEHADRNTLTLFHQPIRRVDPGQLFTVRPDFLCPIFFPDGERYAILFSGMSMTRHINDMEFAYRTLIDKYGFKPANITVLNYNGTLNGTDGPLGTWPGDGTAYRMPVNGQGTQSGFENAINALKPKLKPDDLLFIHTNNHGDNTGGSNLCTYPSYNPYYANDFAAKVGELPKYRSLIVMMEQCFSGGFKAPILAKSTAMNSSVACAATANNVSWATPDLHWDSFAHDWIAAQAGHNPDGSALATNPDVDHDGRIEAEEAFAYALSVQNPSDTPNYDENSEAGGDVSLGQEYHIWWWWCEIVRLELEQPYLKLPPTEFNQRLNTIKPELEKLTAVLNQQSEALRVKTAADVKALVSRAFDKVLVAP